MSCGCRPRRTPALRGRGELRGGHGLGEGPGQQRAGRGCFTPAELGEEGREMPRCCAGRWGGPAPGARPIPGNAGISHQQPRWCQQRWCGHLRAGRSAAGASIAPQHQGVIVPLPPAHGDTDTKPRPSRGWEAPRQLPAPAVAEVTARPVMLVIAEAPRGLLQPSLGRSREHLSGAAAVGESPAPMQSWERGWLRLVQCRGCVVGASEGQHGP